MDKGDDKGGVAIKNNFNQKIPTVEIDLFNLFLKQKIMKAASSKSANNEAASAKPFFNKGGQDAFFLNGNKTENSFFNASGIQASMTVGQPDDPFEKEAEKVSRQVVDGFDQANIIQRKFSSFGLQQFTIQPFTIGRRISRKLQQTISRTPLFVQAKCAHCDEEEKMQRKSGDIQFAGEGATVSPHIESQIQSMKGGGQGMGSDTKTAMESSFGADFSGVKVHTNSQAVQMSQQLNAHAFTVGNDIFFNEGRYQPQSKQGAGLLAHELTHTVQQGASVQNKRINTSSLLSSLAAHSAAHLSAINGGESPELSKKEMAQLEKLPEEEMKKIQQLQMVQKKGIDKVQKKDSSLKLRRCTPSGKGSAPSVTPPTFAVSSFSTTGSGNAVLAENGGLSVKSPRYSSDAKVKVTGNNTEIPNWEVGYIQTIFSHNLESEYEKTFERWQYNSFPIRDGVSKSNVPWYNTHTAATTNGTEISESMDDTPGYTVAWDDPRVTNPNSLQKYKRSFSFGAWLIAKRNSGEIIHLKNIQWAFNFIVNVDKTKAVGGRGSNTGAGMNAITSSNGKGTQDPVLTAPIANEEITRTLVAKP